MYNILAVFVGGGIGSVFRFIINNFFKRFFNINLPLATFGVNFLGSVIIGIAIAYFLENSEVSNVVKYFIIVGFCGGLTTFSTFSLETFEMIKEGHYMFAFGYTMLSVIVCVSGVFVGFECSKYV